MDNITIFYSPHPSNIKGRQYDQETISDRPFIRIDFIRSIFINVRACNLTMVPMWEILLGRFGNLDLATKIQYDAAHSFNTLPADVFLILISFMIFDYHYAIKNKTPFLMVHMVKPEDIPAYTIGKVFAQLHSCLISRVSIEVLIDNYHSSSVYEWKYFRNSDGVYITVDKAVNTLIESSYEPTTTCYNESDSQIWFICHFMHDDKINKYVTRQAHQQTHLSFHNQR